MMHLQCMPCALLRHDLFNLLPPIFTPTSDLRVVSALGSNCLYDVFTGSMHRSGAAACYVQEVGDFSADVALAHRSLEGRGVPLDCKTGMT